MITPVQAKRKVESEYPDREVKSMYQFGSDYLAIAPDKNVKGPDYSDPFFIINSKDGSIKGFLPPDNFKAYEKAMKNEIPL